MAGGMDLGDGGRAKKKAMDAALNLVPFIDLMAVTIVFLILNAAWTQLGRLQVAASGGPGEDAKAEAVSVTVSLTEKKVSLQVGGACEDFVVARGEAGQVKLEGLLARLRAVHKQMPEQAALTLRADDDVRYQDIVAVMDVAMRDGDEPMFPSVTVAQ